MAGIPTYRRRLSGGGSLANAKDTKAPGVAGTDGPRVQALSTHNPAVSGVPVCGAFVVEFTSIEVAAYYGVRMPQM